MSNNLDSLNVGSYTNGLAYRSGLGASFSTSTQEQLRRLQIAQASAKVYKDTQRQLTEAVRTKPTVTAKSTLFENLSGRFAELSSSLSTPKTLTSQGPLALGNGQGNQTTGIDPNAALNAQSFSLPITAGTVNVSFQGNGRPASTQTVAIDPTQSLNQNLQAISSLVFGGTQPITATFQNGQVVYQASTTSGSAFSLSVTDGTSNFASALSNKGASTDGTFTGGTVGTAPGSSFANLTVSFNGDSTTLTGLGTNNPGLSPVQRATQLAARINDGLAASGLAAQGLQAVAGSSGQLQFAGHSTGTGATGGSLSVSESGSGQTLGFAAGFSSSFAASTAPDLNGPDATLGQLSQALGLQSDHGSFGITLNGVGFNFSAQQSLSSALADINSSTAGVTASYDATTRKVTLQQQDASPAPIVAQDTRGNLLDALRLDQAPDANGATSAAGALSRLKDTAQSLSDALSLIESASARGGGLQGNALLRDLGDALRGAFKAGTDPTHPTTLADLGFSRKDGQLVVDVDRQRALVTSRPDDVTAAATAIATQQLAPLLQAAQHALDDDLSRTPQELQLARQNVHARAELVRLQDRQSVLVYQQTALDQTRQTIDAQRKGLEGTTRRILDDSVHVPPQHKDLFPPLHEPLSQSKLPTPAPITPPTVVAQSAPAAGLLSFGLSNTGSSH